MCGILRNARICKCLWKFLVICCWHKAHYSCPSYFSVVFFLIVFHGAHLELEVLCCVVCLYSLIKSHPINGRGKVPASIASQ